MTSVQYGHFRRVIATLLCGAIALAWASLASGETASGAVMAPYGARPASGSAQAARSLFVRIAADDAVVPGPVGVANAEPEPAPSFTPLPDGVFAYPREQIVEAPPAPPAYALPGAVPPLPQINPYWQFKRMAQRHPREKPVRLIDPRNFQVMEDMPPDFAPVDIGVMVADAGAQAMETQAADPLQTGSISGADDDQATELETLTTPDTVTPGQTPGTAAAPEPESQTGTPTEVPEIDVRTNSDSDQQGLRLRARLTAFMEPISRPVEWTIFAIEGADPAAWQQVAAVRRAQPIIVLPAGDYLVEARYGHVLASKPLTVSANAVTDATFVLNAGGLRILSHLVFVDAPPSERAVHFIYSGETDENGMRELIARSEIQGEIIRLNAGSYHLISRLGSANSVVETDVQVSPGVLTAVEVNHKAGVVELVVPGAESQPPVDPVTLQIVDETGAIVARMHGQTGHAVLAPGTYTAVAESAGRSGRAEFQIRIGEAMTIDLTLQ